MENTASRVHRGTVQKTIWQKSDRTIFDPLNRSLRMETERRLNEKPKKGKK